MFEEIWNANLANTGRRRTAGKCVSYTWRICVPSNAAIVALLEHCLEEISTSKLVPRSSGRMVWYAVSGERAVFDPGDVEVVRDPRQDRRLVEFVRFIGFPSHELQTSSLGVSTGPRSTASQLSISSRLWQTGVRTRITVLSISVGEGDDVAGEEVVDEDVDSSVRRKAYDFQVL